MVLTILSSITSGPVKISKWAKMHPRPLLPLRWIDCTHAEVVQSTEIMLSSVLRYLSHHLLVFKEAHSCKWVPKHVLEQGWMELGHDELVHSTENVLKSIQ